MKLSDKLSKVMNSLAKPSSFNLNGEHFTPLIVNDKLVIQYDLYQKAVAEVDKMLDELSKEGGYIDLDPINERFISTVEYDYDKKNEGILITTTNYVTRQELINILTAELTYSEHTPNQRTADEGGSDD